MNASDDFNRSDGGLGSNWTAFDGSSPLVIDTNRVEAATTGEEVASYYNGTWANDQESQAKVTNADSSNQGPIVRASGSAGTATYYAVRVKVEEYAYIAKIVSGTLTDLSGNLSASIANNSVVKLTAVGTTITVYDDGVSIGDITDSSIASGNPGIYQTASGGGNSFLDDWAGADIGGGGGDVSAKIIFEKA